MAPPRRFRSPLEQLAGLLGDARQDGLTFDEAWTRAVRPHMPIVMTNSPRPPEGAIRWPTDRFDRVAWQNAIACTRDTWRRAYELDAQTASDRAVVLLAERGIFAGIGELAAVA